MHILLHWLHIDISRAATAALKDFSSAVMCSIIN